MFNMYSNPNVSSVIPVILVTFNSVQSRFRRVSGELQPLHRHRSPLPVQLQFLHARGRDPASLQDRRGFKVKSCLSKMDSCFIKDVNIADNTFMAPLTPFTKIWRLKKTIIFWIGGDDLSNEVSVELKVPATGVAMNQELDVVVDCIAPELPGKYESCWGLAPHSGKSVGVGEIFPGEL